MFCKRLGNRNRILAAIFVLSFLSATVLADNRQAMEGSVRWYSYQAGMEQIKDTGKKGYLHFYTDWCGYCKMMDKKTFSDKKVAAFLNANFIPMRINAETEKKIAKKYGVNRFPLNWFLDSQAEPIGSQPGYIPPEDMIYILKYVKSESYKDMKFSEFMEAQDRSDSR